MAVTPRDNPETQHRKVCRALANLPGALITQPQLGQVVILGCKAVDRELLAMETTAHKVVVDLQAATTVKEPKEVEKQEAPAYPVHLVPPLTAASPARTLHSLQSLSSLLLEDRLYPAQSMVVQPLLLPAPPSLLEVLHRQPAGLLYPSTPAHLALLSMENRSFFPPQNQRLQQQIHLLLSPQLAAIP